MDTCAPSSTVRRVRAPRGVRRRACTALLLAAGCGAAAAAGADLDTADFSLSGFGTFGIVHNNNTPGGIGLQRDTFERANAGGTRADVDTRLGVQANYRVSREIELVGQAVAANRVAQAPASDAVTLAFVAWRASEDVTLRVGRLSTDYFLLAEYANVGFAYPFVRPPIENYASLPYALDGVELTKTWQVDDAVWKLKAITGRSSFVTSSSSAPLTLRPNIALVLSHDDGEGLQLKASAVRTRVYGDDSAVRPLLGALRQIGALPVAGVADEARNMATVLDVDRQQVSYFSAGASLDRGAWLASLEVSRAQKTRNSYTNAWALVGHRWGAITGYGLVSAIRSEHPLPRPEWTAALTPVIGADAAAQSQQTGLLAAAATGAVNANQTTLAIGARWDVSDRVALKLQWDHVRVAPYGGRLWSGKVTAEPLDAHVVSMTLDFVF